MISIVVPAYNAEKYIADTINSVLNQTYKDWELIIVDDGSKDNTASIVKQFCEKDPRIHYHYKANSGVSDTRNVGMNMAKGEYIALLDADDFFEKENLEEKIRFLDNNEFDWVYSNMYNADENLNILNIDEGGNDVDILNSILSWKGQVVPGPCSNVIFSKKCYEDGVRFDSEFSTAADQDFTIQLAAKYKGKFINKPLWRYRILHNSMSKNIAVMEKDHIGVYKKARKKELFHSKSFENQSFANLYFIIGASWWKDGHNKLKGTKFLIKSFLTSPSFFFKRIRK